MRNLEFHALEELQPGHKLRHMFDNNWLSYRNWYLVDGESARPTYLECLRNLRLHMPELLPLYNRLLDLLECDDLQARFLSLYCPPPFAAGCSQLIWQKDIAALIRNYDFPAPLCEGRVIKSRWLDKQVIAMTDCLWGVLDGINEDGLAASIAFGGRAVEGEGFGISLVIRYILETCEDVEQAIAVLQRVPVHMDYNVALLDKSGAYATVFIAPDRAVDCSTRLISTNRQGFDEVPQYAALADTVVREDYLASQNADSQQTLFTMIRNFLRPPLYRWHRENDFGTLYTAVYYPESRSVQYLWPDRQWEFSIDNFFEQRLQVCYE